MKFDLKYFENYSAVIGCDEVGRGPIAGPVNACSVLVTHKDQNLLKYLEELGVTDSKKLSTKKRLAIIENFNINLDKIEINQTQSVKTEFGSFTFVVTEKTPIEIDQMNILQASLRCMQEGSEKLVVENATVLVDGNKTFESSAKNIEYVIKGDSKSSVIALASIIAKEYRDKLMLKYDEKFPGYALAKNAGYPTKVHKEALINLGVTPIHRKTFKGVKELLD